MNTRLNSTHCFYSEKENCIVDMCTDENPPRSHVYSQTLEEIKARYPDAEYMEFEVATERMDINNRLPVREITKKTWWEMLEALPPVGWKNTGEGESFKMSERFSGWITDIYARVGDRYFVIRDDIRTPHQEVIKRCNEFMQK